MKNIFKFFGIVAVASMLFTACGNEETFTIKVSANNKDYGTVTGGGKFAADETVTLTATPNEGYKFVQWNDGDKNNPRVIVVKQDAEYIAEFAEETGVIVTFGNSTWTAAYVNAQMAPNGILVAAGQTSANSYPIVKLMCLDDNGLTATTYTDGCTLEEAGEYVNIKFGNPYVWYYENGSVPLQNSEAGDWWDKTVTVKFNALDLDAMTASLIVNADMAYFPGILDEEGYLTSLDLNDAPASTLTCKILGQEFTAASKIR